MNICTLDIETPLIEESGSLSLTKIYCIGVKSNDEPTKVFTYIYHKDSAGPLKACLDFINSHDIAIGHNICKFDAPVIANLLGNITIPLVDTLIDSKLMFTKEMLFNIDRSADLPKDLWGSYSLKAFAKRLGGEEKIEFEQFDKLTPEMIEYCARDVDVTYELYKFLTSQPNYPLQQVRELEYAISTMMCVQENCGFYYNKDKAREFATNLKFKRMNLEHQLQREFKPKYLPKGSPVIPANARKNRDYAPDPDYKFKSRIPYRFIHQLPRFKDGRYRMPGKSKYKWFDVPHKLLYIYTVGEYQPIQLTKFNPGSRQQIKLWLEQDYNFVFKTYTEKGSLKVDAEELESLSDSGKAMKDFLKVTKDLSEVEGVLEAYVESTHSIHGKIDTIGARTHRCTHSSPNVAQTSADPIFRSFYTAPEGYTLIGADLANIEVRVLAHYLAPYDGGKYVNAVLSKDMHWYHAGLAGFIDPSVEYDEHNPVHKKARAKSKAFFFSWLYGSGNTVRGNSLWSDDALESYTQEEYQQAKKQVEARIKIIDGVKYFPLKKDKYIIYDEELILQTIYGKRISDTFLERVEGIKQLIEDCTTQAEAKGTITAIDGREIVVVSSHSALNTLLQGSAGVIAKKWGVNWFTKASLAYQPMTDFKPAAYVHDEYQVAVKNELVSEFIDIIESSSLIITDQFSMNIAIKSDAKAGVTWSDTH